MTVDLGVFDAPGWSRRWPGSWTRICRPSATPHASAARWRSPASCTTRATGSPPCRRVADGTTPEPLRRNIIAHNHPVLRRIITSYFHQIEAAVHRQDVVSIHHRLAALVASYFDVLFALNRVLHPGEKPSWLEPAPADPGLGDSAVVTGEGLTRVGVRGLDRHRLRSARSSQVAAEMRGATRSSRRAGTDLPGSSRSRARAR